MRMRELTRNTGVTRETVHFYIREGLLPEVAKSGPNQAEYTNEHVERIRLVKELQEKYFLPLSLIKRIVRRLENSTLDDSLLRIKHDYFKPLDQWLPQQMLGEQAFLEFSGIAPDRLTDFEAWGIISPRLQDDEKIYSHEDVKIGRLIGDMRRFGVSHEKGFEREGLKEARDRLIPITERIAQSFKSGIRHNRFSNEELERLGQAFIELLPLFLYYKSRVMIQEAIEAGLKELIGEENEA